ncbi:MAG TPA: hypothetical protein VHD83_21840 [Puia sp.]|nr:hypothetical protein [Puia sp.]
MSNKNISHGANASWENEPATLTESQRADPINAMRFIANWRPLFRMRYRLKDMFAAAMSSPRLKDDTPEQKGELVWFYDEMTALLELAYHLDDMIRNHQFIYSYPAKQEEEN